MTELITNKKSNWLRRRWLDFRQGHSVYLVFLMTFANFITIQYALLVDRVPLLRELFENPLTFALVFVIIYIPLAMFVGQWHRKHQLKVDQEAMFYENVIGAKLTLFMIDLIDGKATEEEKAEMRNLLEKIVNKGNK